ncbi:C-C motif chemokine ligand 1 [Phyllostomus discolor]|uniref:C-C motif chemokine n=1 Tax=Phyllostomus discolor TaxID=89673 RepID=A0A6J2MD85_9CHIR|nr:C-C motif chemokine 1 [Phyllostomus discolor]KAF6092791.1 C-C motif chemokine ligand 1 [Phyllostomus discolor]
MKLITVALVCLLVAGMWPQDADSRSLLVQAPRCCFRFVKRNIHPSTVHCYRFSSSSCSHGKAVIFKMKRGKEACASHTERWVNSSLSKLEYCK